MSIANRLVKQGYKVLWPVTSAYAPLAKHFPNVTMVDKAFVNIDYNRTDTYEINGCRVLPLRFADSICNVPYTDCMKSKYIFMGQEWETWKDDCIIERDYESEWRLLNHFNIHFTDKFNLISEQFQTGGTRQWEIPKEDYDNGLRNIRMSFIEGATLIDWLSIMQMATNIFAVASSNIYLFELFKMKAKIHLYVRRPTNRTMITTLIY